MGARRASSTQRTALPRPGLPIVHEPDPRLEVMCHAVKRLDPATLDLLGEMLRRAQELNGWGLAAPQVGVRLKMFVYRERPTFAWRKVINGYVAQASPELVYDWEGCFSVPGAQVEVPRAEWVVVRGMDERGRPLRLEAQGMHARVLQHEIDHTEGRIITRFRKVKT